MTEEKLEIRDGCRLADLVLRSAIDHLSLAFDESAVQTWPTFPVAPPKVECVGGPGYARMLAVVVVWVHGARSPIFLSERFLPLEANFGRHFDCLKPESTLGHRGSEQTSERARDDGDRPVQNDRQDFAAEKRAVLTF